MKKSPFAVLKEKNIRQEIYMLLPACILLIVFMVAPFVSAFGLSLTNQKLIPNPMVPAKFVGFRNYIQIFKDTSFWQAFKNVILFTYSNLSFLVILFIVNLLNLYCIYIITYFNLFVNNN